MQLEGKDSALGEREEEMHPRIFMTTSTVCLVFYISPEQISHFKPLLLRHVLFDKITNGRKQGPA